MKSTSASSYNNMFKPAYKYVILLIHVRYTKFQTRYDVPYEMEFSRS